MARNALLASHDVDAAAHAAQALQRAGFHVYAAAATGLELARRGIMTLPSEQLSGRGSILGGRVELFDQRIMAGLLGRRHQPREAEQLSRAKIHSVDVVAIRLPLQPRDLDPQLDADDATHAAELLRLGGFLGQAGLLEAAVLCHHDVVPIVDFHGCGADLTALGHDALAADRRAALAASAYAHLTAFRAFLTWALDFEAAAPAPVPPPRRATAAMISGAMEPLPAEPVEPAAPAPADAGVAQGEAAPSDVAAGAASGGADLALPPELPIEGSTRLQIAPTSIGPAFRLEALDDGALDAQIYRDSAAALDALWALGAPGVASARAGLCCALVRAHSTATRAVLRAVGVDPRAVEQGLLVASCEIDLTAARVICESEPTAPLRTIVAAAFMPEALALLRDAGRRCLRFEIVATQPTHRLGGDAFGPLVQSIADPRAGALDQAGTLSAAAKLGLAVLGGQRGHGATVVNAEGTLAIAGGQPHVADAVQICLGKARKHAVGATLVLTGTLRDPQLVQAAAKLGVVGIVELATADDAAASDVAAVRDAAAATKVTLARVRPGRDRGADT